MAKTQQIKLGLDIPWPLLAIVTVLVVVVGWVLLRQAKKAIESVTPDFLKDEPQPAAGEGAWVDRFASVIDWGEGSVKKNDYEKPSTYPQLPAFDDDGVNVPYGVTPYQSEETMFFTGGSQFFNERTGEYIGGA